MHKLCPLAKITLLVFKKNYAKDGWIHFKKIKLRVGCIIMHFCIINKTKKSTKCLAAVDQTFLPRPENSLGPREFPSLGYQKIILWAQVIF